MIKKPWIRMQVGLALVLAIMGIRSASADSGAPDLKRLERSFSIHASLASLVQSDQWSTNFPSASAPTEIEIRNAARLLTYDYAANRLYLVYHKELPLMEARTAFQVWRHVCPPEVELVPTLALRCGQTNQNELFTTNELRFLIAFFKREINPRRVAVLNVGSNINELVCLRALASEYGDGVIRAGIQPDEPLDEPFTAAVEDAGAAICNAESNADWQQPESGRETLRKRVQSRNATPLPVTWTLAVVGAGDPDKKMPLTKGRNTLAVGEILHFAMPALIAGFSTDLQRLQVDSRVMNHDGAANAFYQTLKDGRIYVGYYARPFHEVVKIYTTLRSGKVPGH
jgi:hypothetical protein